MRMVVSRHRPPAHLLPPPYHSLIRGVGPTGQSPGEKPPACGHHSTAPCAPLGASTALGAHLRPGRPSPARGIPEDAAPRVRVQLAASLHCCPRLSRVPVPAFQALESDPCRRAEKGPQVTEMTHSEAGPLPWGVAYMRCSRAWWGTALATVGSQHILNASRHAA